MTRNQTIYHLTPAGYYHSQPEAQPYRPESFADDGFIHCTAGVELLLRVANAFYHDLPDDLLVLEIDPARLEAPLKYELPASLSELPPVAGETALSRASLRFPHLYGPLNRQAIVGCFALLRDGAGNWRMPQMDRLETGVC